MEEIGERSSGIEHNEMVRAESTVAIDVTISARINFASAQNAVPIIKSLTLRASDDRAFEGLRLTLNAQPPFLREKTWVFDRLDADNDVTIQDRDLTHDFAFLDGLNEAEHGQLTFALLVGERMIAEIDFLDESVVSEPPQVCRDLVARPADLFGEFARAHRMPAVGERHENALGLGRLGGDPRLELWSEEIEHSTKPAQE